MSEWTLISNHGLVLAYIAKNPRSTAREIAAAIKITERMIRNIINDLHETGYIQRQRVRRNNLYSVNMLSPLRHETVRETKVGDFLKALGYTVNTD